MTNTSTVLLTLSISVTAPRTVPSPQEGIDEILDSFLDGACEKLLEVASQLKHEPWYEDCYGVSYHYLTGDPDFVEKNVEQCSKCGKWTTDVDLPESLDLVKCGSRPDGMLVCFECQLFENMALNP